jgi:hypothetical protein
MLKCLMNVIASSSQYSNRTGRDDIYLTNRKVLEETSVAIDQRKADTEVPNPARSKRGHGVNCRFTTVACSSWIGLTLHIPVRISFHIS